MNIYAVIMAGGSGTRFWPLSRRTKPKQFLDIAGAKPMVEETVERIRPFVGRNKIFTVAGAQQTSALKNILKGLPRDNFIVEPLAKNTAPSLMLATAKIFLKDPRAVVVALAADHLIREPGKFLEKVEAGAEAASRTGAIVTFGIPPTFPATGYGYIRFSRKESREIRGVDFYPVLEFKEKPKLGEAKRFLAAGNYYWNSGMFIWRADVFSRKLKRYAPQFYPFWGKMLKALADDDRKALRAVFEEIPTLSIDYALMEKVKGVLACAGDFGWSDVGSWSSLHEIWPADDCHNAIRGEFVTIDSKNCLVHNPDQLTALIGVQDLIVVKTEDVLLVCRRDMDQKVKDIVEKLQKKQSRYL